MFPPSGELFISILIYENACCKCAALYFPCKRTKRARAFLPGMGSLNENAEENASGLDFLRVEEYKYTHQANISVSGGRYDE